MLSTRPSFICKRLIFAILWSLSKSLGFKCSNKFRACSDLAPLKGHVTPTPPPFFYYYFFFLFMSHFFPLYFIIFLLLCLICATDRCCCCCFNRRGWMRRRQRRRQRRRRRRRMGGISIRIDFDTVPGGKMRDK